MSVSDRVWRQFHDHALASYEAALPDAALAILVGEKDSEVSYALKRPAALIARKAVEALSDEDLLELVGSELEVLMRYPSSSGYDWMRNHTDQADNRSRGTYGHAFRETLEYWLVGRLCRNGMERKQMLAGDTMRAEIAGELQAEVVEHITEQEDR